MTTQKETPPKFNAERARKRIGKFVNEVDDPTLNWAWEVVQGVIHAYANASIQPGDTLLAKVNDYWYDFLDSWHGGSANFGLIGFMTEFGSACPEDRAEEQEVVMAEAFALGKGEKLVRPSKVLDVAEAGAVAKPQPAIRLVVDNSVRS
jgi:hypothetical protein